MKRLHTIYTIIMLLACAFTASAENKTTKSQIIKTYTKELSTATSARDSVRILYYLFDLSDRKGQIKYAWDIYHTAERAENVNAQLDMLRNLGNFYAYNDSVVEYLLKLTEKIFNDDARAATRTYIINQHINRKSRHPEDTQLQTMLLDSITKAHDYNGGDIYDKISLLYQIIQYLGIDADGVLFKECLDRYAELMEGLPNSDYPLKNQFYTTAAMIHSRMNGNPQKAIQFDRNLIDIIEQLQQMYLKKGRKFRNYDTNKFISYRRMMSNYAALTNEEIEEIHDSLRMLYDRDPDVKRTMDKEGQAFAFYYMATKNYEEAVPALKGILKNHDMSAYQKQKYNSMLIEASKEIGDKQTYISAMEDYITFSRQIDSLRKITMKREIMLRDSIMPTPLLYKEPSSAQKKNMNDIRKTDKALVAVSSVLAILLIIYMTLYFRLRQKKYGL
ncbi:MAG: hypothetical protein K2J58_04930 [Muribaculaceae bacterium]|nr:hypothetical protein [Muribaculaceae bacterium]